MGQPITFSGPDAEFKDVERRKLMTELLRAFRKLEILNGASAGTYKSRIDPLGWSLLWLSDIESLRDIIEDFKRSPWPTLSIIRSMISLATFQHNCKHSSPCWICAGLALGTLTETCGLISFLPSQGLLAVVPRTALLSILTT